MASQQPSLGATPLPASSKNSTNLRSVKKLPLENVKSSMGNQLSGPLNSHDGTTRSCPSSPRKEMKITKKTPKSKRKDSSSSDSSDSEEETKKMHPTSKLPMFRGIGSIISNKSASQDISSKNSSEDITAISKVKEERKFSTKKNSLVEASSSILQKFESFSDVWKDADEPSHFEKPSSRFNAKGGRKHDFEENVHKPQERPWQSQRQLLSNHDKISAFQEHDLNGSSATNIAEQKRLKSLETRRQAFEQQKMAVKLALSDKVCCDFEGTSTLCVVCVKNYVGNNFVFFQSASRMNKKIVFDDEDNNDYFQPSLSTKEHIAQSKKDVADHSSKKRKALSLFDDSDDETVEGNWNGDFKVKKQFEGEKGKKVGR